RISQSDPKVKSAWNFVPEPNSSARIFPFLKVRISQSDPKVKSAWNFVPEPNSSARIRPFLKV
ncbi:MAG: hypothetical protein K2I44_08760, partial [Muribaculaceae bacterium]|nr:hypothetical protein [Muribaculaceae bacterium]